MHVLQALQDLVDDVLLVDVFEDVCANDCVKISIHEVEDQVDVAVVFCSDYVLQPNNVLVPSELLKENDLAEGALRVSSILESVEVLLQGNDLLSALIDGLPHDTVRSLSYRQVSTKSPQVRTFTTKSVGEAILRLATTQIQIAANRPQPANPSGETLG